LTGGDLGGGQIDYARDKRVVGILSGIFRFGVESVLAQYYCSVFSDGWCNQFGFAGEVLCTDQDVVEWAVGFGVGDRPDNVGFT
jgi:hypothetical protein